MAALNEIRKERLRKLELLIGRGIDPYPAKSGRDTAIGALIHDFEKYANNKSITVAGRVMAIREHGGSAFIDLYDGTGKIQGFLTEEKLGDSFILFKDVVDIGDFIDLSGIPMLQALS